ncbi:hypothetical protein ACFRH9_17260 [Peribacillus butanolivorans]|uniref:hypothetical protein n=1 Tax=Peribacillus butanolivorans TaxID=421767 RepID=UPI00366E2C1C
MDKKMQRNLLLIVIGTMIAFPIIINILMFIQVFPVAGDQNSWISTLGSFWGAIIGGVLTLYGVKKSIDHNEEIRRKENFPHRLFHLEKALSYLEEVRKDFDNIQSLSFSNNKPPSFFMIDANLNVEKLDKYHLYTAKLFENLNEDLIYVDSKSYRLFFEFRRGVNDLFKEIMADASIELFNFSQTLITKEHDVINIPWGELPMSDTQKDQLNKIKTKFHDAESNYISSESILITTLYFDLTEHYFSLIEEMNY